eukprot:363696-Chlamydomonas_euryale.AAC.21
MPAAVRPTTSASVCQACFRGIGENEGKAGTRCARAGPTRSERGGGLEGGGGIHASGRVCHPRSFTKEPSVPQRPSYYPELRGKKRSSPGSTTSPAAWGCIDAGPYALLVSICIACHTLHGCTQIEPAPCDFDSGLDPTLAAVGHAAQPSAQPTGGRQHKLQRLCVACAVD